MIIINKNILNIKRESAGIHLTNGFFVNLCCAIGFSWSDYYGVEIDDYTFSLWISGWLRRLHIIIFVKVIQCWNRCCDMNYDWVELGTEWVWNFINFPIKPLWEIPQATKMVSFISLLWGFWTRLQLNSFKIQFT